MLCLLNSDGGKGIDSMISIRAELLNVCYLIFLVCFHPSFFKILVDCFFYRREDNITPLFIFRAREISFALFLVHPLEQSIEFVDGNCDVGKFLFWYYVMAFG